MIDPDCVPDVAEDETVARFVFYRGHVRADKTVKPAAFIPPSNGKMSVTRNLLASEPELWQVGERIATDRNLTLQGRSDLQVRVIRGQQLDTVADPIQGNPNHANVKDWPADKPAQKLIAAELAKASAFKACPAIAPEAMPYPQDPRLSPNPAAPAEPAARMGWFVRALMVCRGFLAQVAKRLRIAFRKKSP